MFVNEQRWSLYPCRLLRCSSSALLYVCSTYVRQYSAFLLLQPIYYPQVFFCFLCKRRKERKERLHRPRTNVKGVVIWLTKRNKCFLAPDRFLPLRTNRRKKAREKEKNTLGFIWKGGMMERKIKYMIRRKKGPKEKKQDNYSLLPVSFLNFNVSNKNMRFIFLERK